MHTPRDQRSPYDLSGAKRSPKRDNKPAAVSPHSRQGQRGEPDDPAPLPRFVRYRDLVAAGITASWTQLLRLIESEGFPSGRMLSPNTRAWTVDEIAGWLDARPAPTRHIGKNLKARAAERDDEVRP
jgi:predicted DNA-binding transcriptional regulator AlpA